MPEWKGILNPKTEPAVIAAYSRDLGSGLLRFRDGRMVPFHPAVFNASPARSPREGEEVQAHFGLSGIVSALVPAEARKALHPAWYDFVNAEDESTDGSGVGASMTTTDWFEGLTRSERKNILSVLHDARAQVQVRHMELFQQLLSHLEDDHEEAKKGGY